MKKILVLGSNSCAGAGVIGELAKSQVYDILPTSRGIERPSFYLPYKWQDYPTIRPFEQLDLNTQLDKLEDILETFNPNYVINFASQSMVGESWENPEDWMQTNVTSLMKLVQVLQNKKCIEKYVHFSTPEVYGDTGSSWIKENSNFQPTTPYALSRACGDQIVNMWRENFDFPVVITRSANVYGSGQQLYRIIPKAIYSIIKGQKIPLHGGGLSIRSFIHYVDIASAIDIILQKGQIGETYHLSPPKNIAILELIKLISNKLRVNFCDVVEKSPDRRGKDQYYLLESEKICKIGWKPTVTLSDGINECIGWVKKNWKNIPEESLTYIHTR